MLIQAEKVVTVVDKLEDLIGLDGLEVPDYEIDLVDSEYIDIEELNRLDKEFDRNTIRNIREKAALIMDLITSHDQVLRTNHPARTRHEINGGYKIATRRGARLHEVEVFNLYFKFSSHLRGDGIALMYRTKDKRERIILLPDDTEKRLEIETRLYSESSRQFLFRDMMESEVRDELVENLKLLNIHERCAQSLQREYGHILHWREFDHIGIHTMLEIYDWFVDSG